MAAPPPLTSRTREKPAGDEEATSVLSLGEFQHVHPLSLSEAHVLINAVIKQRKNANPRGVRETETLFKTLEYLQLFARFKQQVNVEQVERLLNAVNALEPFEKSQLASLVCEDTEEAKYLIPSLVDKISDQDLKPIVREIVSLAEFEKNRRDDSD